MELINKPARKTDCGTCGQDIEPVSKRYWGQFLRSEAKYVRAIENQVRLGSFGKANSFDFLSRRMNASQRRRFWHWDKVADRMADKMDRV